MEKQKSVRKLKPCSCRKTEKFEKWLEDMALEGFILESCSTDAAYARFTVDQPQRLNYICVPKPSDYILAEFREILKAYGFEKCESTGTLEFYKSKSHTAKEIRSNSRFFKICKRLKLRSIAKSTIFMAVLCTIFLILSLNMPLLLKYGNVFTLPVIILTIALIIVTVTGIIKYIQIKNDKKSEKPQNLDWKRNSAFFKFKSFLSFFVSAAITFSPNLIDKQFIESFEEPQTPPPFVTGREFIDESEGEASFRRYKEWSSVLAPVSFEWIEFISLTPPDGTKENILMDISYFETVTAAAARKAAKDFTRNEKFSSLFIIQSREINDLGVEYQQAFENYNGDLILVLQNGKKVMRIIFEKLSAKNIPEEWFEPLSQSIK